ncbi:MAG: hypothetical protein H6573_00050 [Lewinellaceae bacterium]|nr:hypothetical protein [Phaeodactylibacter sp.]MCB0613104.1 hypothetical protein [Phaeodactylibacter sp.]MCB9345887.1 hypothetical protein [Lewinellaceae bacterium]
MMDIDILFFGVGFPFFDVMDVFARRAERLKEDVPEVVDFSPVAFSIG